MSALRQPGYLDLFRPPEPFSRSVSGRRNPPLGPLSSRRPKSRHRRALVGYCAALLLGILSGCKKVGADCDAKKQEICEMQLIALRNSVYLYDSDKRVERPDTNPETFYFPSWEELDVYFPRGAPRKCPCGQAYVLDSKSIKISCPLGDSHGHVIKGGW